MWLSESVLAVVSNKQVRLLYSGFMNPGKYSRQTFQQYKQQDSSLTHSRLSKVSEGSVLESGGSVG